MHFNRLHRQRRGRLIVGPEEIDSCPIGCIEIDVIQDQNLEHLGSGKVWRKLEYKFGYARKLCRRAEMTTLYETWTCSRHHSHVSF